MKIDTLSLAGFIEDALKQHATTNIRRIRPKQRRKLAEEIAQEAAAEIQAEDFSGGAAENTGSRLETLGISIDSALGIAKAIRKGIVSLDGNSPAALESAETYTWFLLRGFFHAWMDKLRKEAEITMKAWSQIPDEKK